jgi:hypothetical protein
VAVGIQAITKDDGFVRGIYGLLPPVGSEKLAPERNVCNPVLS